MRRLSRLEVVRLELHEALQGSCDPDAHLPKLLQLVIQAALEQEVVEYRGRVRYERGPTKRGLRNGYEPRRLKTDNGVIIFDVPQLRETDGPYRSQIARMARVIYPQLAKLSKSMLLAPPSLEDVRATFKAQTGESLLNDCSLEALTKSLHEEHMALVSRVKK